MILPIKSHLTDLNKKTTWLDGASLAQTLFTNLYFHDPNLIEDSFMKYFTIGMLKIVDWMRGKILNAAVFEEVYFNFSGRQ